MIVNENKQKDAGIGQLKKMLLGQQNYVFKLPQMFLGQ